jgi:hypothetical protein
LEPAGDADLVRHVASGVVPADAVVPLLRLIFAAKNGGETKEGERKRTFSRQVGHTPKSFSDTDLSNI